MKEINSKFLIQPWKDEGTGKVLGNSSQILFTLQDFWVYFNCVNPKSKGGPLYMNIWVLMDLLHDQMVAENGWWLA